ncbi:hypothetical protein J1N35_018393 [Gossypium stocksii]|uniref:Major facilitator superfamily (MFS) profile domain-containing protein n=1 Tax=Gossypium stocksii TaxID=47602 RepID=A0A9D4A766_9ROSI|nr:hypothetical protein J1N35_018393 [Gossypium stocksii]
MIRKSTLNSPKRDATILKRQLSHLQIYLGRIKYMTKLPNSVIIVDQQDEYTALRECITLGIPTICLINTNSDLGLANIPVPTNNEAIASIRENGNDSNKYEKIETYATEEEIMLTHNNNKPKQKMAKDEDDIVNVKIIRDDTRKYVVACAIFASPNSVLLGYDVGVMSRAIIFIQQDLKIKETQQEILVGILSIVSLLGSLAGGKTSHTIGRKWTIALACIVFQLGAAIMALAPSYQILMIGRLLAGIRIGFSIMIAPVYIAEISPSIARGSLTSFQYIQIGESCSVWGSLPRFSLDSPCS